MASSSPLTVCHLLNSLENGGAQNILLSMVENADESVEYLVGYHSESDASIESQLVAAGARTFQLEHSVMFDPRAIAQLDAVIEREGVDVMHGHLPYQQLLARLCGRRQDIPVIGTHHNLGTTPHEAVLSLEKLSRRLDSRTVGVTESVRRAHESRWFDGENQWDVVYNGIDIEDFRSRVEAHDPAETDGITYLNIGRYIPAKAQLRQIEAMESIVEDAPDSELYIVGYGPLEEELRDAVRDRGLEDNVEVTGYTDEPEQYYAKADVYVSTAPEEGHPITVVEAMASGLPVVSCHFEGAQEVIADGETGILVPTDDHAALVDALTEVQSASVRRELGANAYQRALSKFDIKKVAGEYTDIYASVTA